MFKDIEALSQAGLGKYQLMKEHPLQFFIKSIMAGAYLGVAAILSYVLGALLQDFPFAAKIAVAASFGIGLVAIIFLGAELFTGNCFVTVIPVFNKDLKLTQILPMWITCYIGNAIGIGLLCFLFIKGGSQESIMIPYLQSLMDTKLNFDIVQLFIRGILCNFIVCMATYSGIKVQDGAAKLIMVMLLVMAFVLPGFEHCVANMGIFSMGVTQLGNAVPYSLIPLHMLISTLGNIVGGSVFLGIPVYMMFKTNK